jgi:hypothetical protein
MTNHSSKNVRERSAPQKVQPVDEKLDHQKDTPTPNSEAIADPGFVRPEDEKDGDARVSEGPQVDMSQQRAVAASQPGGRVTVYEANMNTIKPDITAYELAKLLSRSTDFKAIFSDADFASSDADVQRHFVGTQHG